MNRIVSRSGEKRSSRYRSGFTMIEIMVALLVAALSSAGIIRGIVVAKGLNQSSEQRVVAFSMARAQLEETMGREYTGLISGGAPTWERDLPMTHLGGASQVQLNCERLTFVIQQYHPSRKEIYILVRWTYRGRLMSEWIRGVKYAKG